MFWMMLLILTIKVTYINSKYASPCVTTNQQPGLCMPVKSCKPIYDMLVKISQNGGTITENDKLELAKQSCGTFKNVPHVCCSKEDIQLNPEGLNILNNTCGLYSFNRIANGHTEQPFQFPWMVLLKYDIENNPFVCGGTLISDQHVLTAAHCVSGRDLVPKEVRLGEYRISTDHDCTEFAIKNECAPPVEDVEIEEFILHEDYRRFYNDIALVKLKRKVEFKRNIKPICLPIYDNLRTKEHENFIVSGWGKTENGTSSDILLAAFVHNVNRTDCQTELQEYGFRHQLNEGHICAGSENLFDSCRGDSGGPLGYQDYYNERLRFIQFGIVSFGVSSCGVLSVPGIYTNVSHYTQWITDNLKENSQNQGIIASRLTQGNVK